MYIRTVYTVHVSLCTYVVQWRDLKDGAGIISEEEVVYREAGMEWGEGKRESESHGVTRGGDCSGMG